MFFYRAAYRYRSYAFKCKPPAKQARFVKTVKRRYVPYPQQSIENKPNKLSNPRIGVDDIDLVFENKRKQNDNRQKYLEAHYGFCPDRNRFVANPATV